MKNRSWLFLLTAVLLTGLTLCEKDKAVNEVVVLPTTVILVPASDSNGVAVVPASEIDEMVVEHTPEGIPYHFNSELNYGSVTDIEGNTYRTIDIGEQTWMAENLKTTLYNDGSQIPEVVNDAVWADLTTGAYRWYNNDVVMYKNKYGALYNWYAVNTGKLCPTGWHVSGDDDWKQLEMTLGMTKEEVERWGDGSFGDICRGTCQGDYLKSADGWDSHNKIAQRWANISGFSALPAGETDWYGHFKGVGFITNWWVSEGGGARTVCSEDGLICRGVYCAHTGMSVRCVKD